VRVCVKALRARRDRVLGKTGTPTSSLTIVLLSFNSACTSISMPPTLILARARARTHTRVPSRKNLPSLTSFLSSRSTYDAGHEDNLSSTELQGFVQHVAGFQAELVMAMCAEQGIVDKEDLYELAQRVSLVERFPVKNLDCGVSMKTDSVELLAC